MHRERATDWPDRIRPSRDSSLILERVSVACWAFESIVRFCLYSCRPTQELNEKTEWEPCSAAALESNKCPFLSGSVNDRQLAWSTQ